MRYGLSDEPDFEPPRPAEVAFMYPELDDHPAFQDVRRQRVETAIEFDSDSHIALLRTDSLILTLGERDRSAFLNEIAKLINTRYHGMVTRAFCYEIVSARRRRTA